MGVGGRKGRCQSWCPRAPLLAVLVTIWCLLETSSTSWTCTCETLVFLGDFMFIGSQAQIQGEGHTQPMPPLNLDVICVSDAWKSLLRASIFQIFPGGGPPDPPLWVLTCSAHQLRASPSGCAQVFYKPGSAPGSVVWLEKCMWWWQILQAKWCMGTSWSWMDDVIVCIPTPTTSGNVHELMMKLGRVV